MPGPPGMGISFFCWILQVTHSLLRSSVFRKLLPPFALSLDPVLPITPVPSQPQSFISNGVPP